MPKNTELNKSKRRNGALDLHRSVDRGFADTAQARDQGEDHTDDDADDETEIGPLRRRQEMGCQGAVREKFESRDDGGRRRGEEPRRQTEPDASSQTISSTTGPNKIPPGAKCWVPSA